MASDELPRKLSDPAPNDEDPLPYDDPEPTPVVDGVAELPLVDSRT